MVYNNNNNNLMELPLKTQLAILKLAKTEYKSVVNNKKINSNYTKIKFVEGTMDIGLCNILSSSICKCLGERYISYTDIKYYIPIFNVKEVIRLRELYNNKLKIPDIDAPYWYPVDEYQTRINLLNLLIHHLQLKIKENGEQSCNS